MDQMDKLYKDVENRTGVDVSNLTNEDLLNLALAQGAVYRFASSGSIYEIKWTLQHSPMQFDVSEIRRLVLERMIRVLPILEPAENVSPVISQEKSKPKRKKS